MDPMKTICFIYRKPRPEYFSIEKVFSSVRKQLRSEYKITEIIVPYSKVTPWHVLQNIRSVSKCRADIFHVTGDAHYLALGRPGKKTILTIHDCVFLNQPNRLKRFFLKKLLLDLPVRHSRIITTISDNSKRDIVTNSGCPPEKVVVIPNPIDDSIYFSEKEFKAICPVILFVGTTPNKNLERVITAIKDMECLLDVIGRIPPAHKILLETNKIRYTESFSISSAQLADKYAKSDLLLFPSTYEGFGLPILEAQRAGRPVITSDVSPMKEIAGQGACLVDPYSPASIKEAILKIISDAEYRVALVNHGLSNVKRFSAEQTAQKYKEVYESLLL
jgi:glycosyltransferase involved in cell wall biosynthesis